MALRNFNIPSFSFQIIILLNKPLKQTYISVPNFLPTNRSILVEITEQVGVLI